MMKGNAGMGLRVKYNEDGRIYIEDGRERTGEEEGKEKEWRGCHAGGQARRRGKEGREGREGRGEQFHESRPLESFRVKLFTKTFHEKVIS